MITLDRETWIAELRGAEVSIIAALLYYAGPGYALNPAEIAEYTGYSRVMVGKGLEHLESLGVCNNQRPTGFEVLEEYDDRPQYEGTPPWYLKDWYITADGLTFFDQLATVILRVPGLVSGELPPFVRRPRHPKGGWIYFLAGGGYYKIGKAKELGRRIEQIMPRLPFEVTLAYQFETADIDQAERQMHVHFADKRANGEWFALDADDLAWIQNYIEGQRNPPNEHQANDSGMGT